MTKSTILVVDDETINLDILYIGLSKVGYKVLVATSGENALKSVARIKPDLILLDIKMPGIDGYEVCRQMKNNSDTQDIPIIFVSVADDTVNKVKGFKLGAVDYITKPFQLDEIVARVQTHSTIHNLRRHLGEQNAQLEQEMSERKRVEKVSAEREHYFRSLIHNLHEDILVIDPDYRIVDVNNKVLNTTGLKREQVIGRYCFNVLHGYDTSCDKHGEHCMLHDVFKTGRPCSYQHIHLNAYGSKVYVDILLSPLKDKEGNVTHVIESIRDISDLMQVQDELRESEEKWRSLTENSPYHIMLLDMDYTILFINHTVPDLTIEQVIGKSSLDFVHPDSRQIAIDSFERVIRSGKPDRYETKYITVEGKTQYFDVRISPVMDADENITGFISTSGNITDSKLAEEKLARMVNIDGLTQIANRRYFDTYLKQEWQRLARGKDYLSLIFLDIDYFKSYNDYHGHLAGDDFLKKFAQILNQCAGRPTDLAARYGGDEFVVILPNTNEQGAMHVAKQIQENVSKLQIGYAKPKINPYFTCSIGIVSMIPHNEFPLAEFIAITDQALYIAKEKGRNQIILSVP